MNNLTRAEYEALMTLAQVAIEAAEPEEWWRAFVDLALGPLFHADVVAVASVDHSDSQGTFNLVKPDWAEAAVPSGSAMHQDLLRNHPVTRHLRGPRALETVRVSDLVTATEWQNMAGFSKMRELIGATFQMSITVATSDMTTLSTGPIRSSKDFTLHEMEVARQVRRLLCSAEASSRARRAQRGNFEAQALVEADRAAESLKITPREQLVLNLLAAGLTTAAAARTLHVSPRTVSKHQENLYRKLRVQDRLGAVLVAQHLGLCSNDSPPGAVSGTNAA